MKQKIIKLLQENLFHIVPYNLTVIDKDYNILLANRNFENYFGLWEGKKCYEVYKKSKIPCKQCQVEKVFKEGIIRVSNEAGIDRFGVNCYYIVHLAPLINDKGKIDYVVEMSTDITKTTSYQKEYNIFFEHIPEYVTVIDKDYRIVRANTKFRNTFGEILSKHCYEIYKKRKTKCRNCPAALTFMDGKDHVSTEVGLTYTGIETQYIVTTTPLTVAGEEIPFVIEIATDITELNQLHEQLQHANDFLKTLINNSQDAIIAVNESGKTEIFNPAAKLLFEWNTFKKPVLNQLKKMLPEGFFSYSDEDGVILNIDETYIKSAKGEKIPVKINAVKLKSKKEELGRVAFMQDLRPIKELERRMLDAERLGTVGQTVAGLAHTIKNLLMGLEGGIYIVDTGLKQGDAKRILEGWDILLRNFNKTTELVKGFLNFAKGGKPTLGIVKPNELVLSIINLYYETAKKQNVEITSDLNPNTMPIIADSEGMEACLTNLISNAIDAASVREDRNGIVVIKVYDTDDDEIVFEVRDNGSGIEAEVLKNVFSTFFTTKGTKGTGLGLLITNKIVMEHEGKIEVKSELGIGSSFIIRLSRSKLKKLYMENINSDSKRG